jgi:hypothetical protein
MTCLSCCDTVSKASICIVPVLIDILTHGNNRFSERKRVFEGFKDTEGSNSTNAIERTHAVAKITQPYLPQQK